MQEIINRILEGDFGSENGSLDFSCAKIELSLQKGDDCHGSFEIIGNPERYTQGKVTASDMRMECLNPDFTGSNVVIEYCFHGAGMSEGDVVKGAFYIVSNQGEYYIPFVVTIEHAVLQSSIGPMKNLFHFANLAKSNWQEAITLFYSPKFECLFDGNDFQYLEAYRALSVYPGKEQNMEEFLIQINKKQKVEFSVEDSNLDLELLSSEGSYEVLEREILIARNGWGYTALNIECDGEFLFVEKELLTDDDFLGNRCRLPVYIDSSCCRAGNNFGRVVLYNSYVYLEVAVQVKVGERNVLSRGEMEKKRNMVQLLDRYQDFRMKKINTAGWLKETGKLVENLITLDERDISARLFKAQLLITEERYAEADWMLEHAREMLEKEITGSVMRADRQAKELWCYYLYLTTLSQKDENYVNQVAEEVEMIYRSDKGSWRIAWLLLYLSEEFHKSNAIKWQFVERQFELGCTSFALYIEALQLLNMNPTLLRKLGDFELQVLHYGVKREGLSAELTEQFLYLSGKVREYHPVHYAVLEGLYRKKKDERVLQEICTLLIKGGKSGPAYFDWYKRGVEGQLRITNLYEYYMLSVNLNEMQELPKMVLLYFSYQNNLDYARTAYLYRYIYDNADKIGDLYESYRLKIESFVTEQIAKEHINRNLAYLYTKLLTTDMINEHTATPLAKLLFAHQIQVEDLRMQKVLVYHPNNTAPTEYALHGGTAWISLYGNDYTICFEDAFRNRFTKNVEYTLEKLMLSGKYVKSLATFVNDYPLFDLFLYDSYKAADRLTEENAWRAERLLANPDVTKSLKQELSLKLLQYYYEADDMDSLDALLEELEPEQFEQGDRAVIVRYMVLRGDYVSAFRQMKQFGPYFIEMNSLVRLVSALTSAETVVEDETLVAAAAHVFKRGKYNNSILEYLCSYYEGMARDLRDLWKASKDFGVDCYQIAEKILIQMLYSGAFVGEKMEIFRYYMSQGAKQDVESAFLARCAYDFFVKQDITEPFVMQEIHNMHKRGEPVQKVCKLAYLKYYAENPKDVLLKEDPVIEEWLAEMMREKIHFNFYKDLRGYAHLLRELADKTIVEYRAHPGAKAKMHYVILRENGEAEDYLAEYMTDAFGGVCFKEFVLFFGETLQYYIMEEYDGREELTESGTLQKSDIGPENQGAMYDMINDVMISMTLQDYDTMDEVLDIFYRREYYGEQLFTLKLSR